MLRYSLLVEAQPDPCRPLHHGINTCYTNMDRNIRFSLLYDFAPSRVMQSDTVSATDRKFEIKCAIQMDADI